MGFVQTTLARHEFVQQLSNAVHAREWLVLMEAITSRHNLIMGLPTDPVPSFSPARKCGALEYIRRGLGDTMWRRNKKLGRFYMGHATLCKSGKN